ncbi:protelomerase family protein [Gloeothece verrucosa]|uniref:Telomere resolvase ResT/TelK catalytic domain-containing protein n=1 Tax=Gloeothece verrucosa (strain PCC 7822) TaxID=497965 RepID=E0UMV0_GLOV7|nr:protelomerase family protein [Gloeothece verrucosa]ADN18280.1 hypothetical protein Cyan7822_6506 [Gloeothece verrucosa PCC 7822]
MTSAFLDSYDLTREEIIARYRSRIVASKRSKLSKGELEQLILHFIEGLKTLCEPSVIKLLCDAEIALLQEGYAQSTVAFDYLPKYRKAIENAIASKIIPITATNSHHYIHTQRVTGIEEERSEHYALTYLKYDEATYESLDSRSQQINRHRQLTLKGVNPNQYLEQLHHLLQSQDQFALHHQAIAIAGLTGRRIGEVVARGKFTLSTHPYLLRFLGHSKTERDAYDIVTLIPASELLPFIDQFRSSSEIKPLNQLEPEELATQINKFNVQINRECNKHLAEIVPALEGKENISVHNLRSLWGVIAAYFFCPPSSHEYPFLQHYLGHVMESSATGHYFRYRLVDAAGDYLEDRGILIPSQGELPKPPADEGHSTQSRRDENNCITDSVYTNISEERERLLNSDNYLEVLTGLMAVTGRTPAELFKSAVFKPDASDPRAVLFSSTITNVHYRLVTLVDAILVLEAIQRLKKFQEAQFLLYQTPEFIDSHCLPNVQQVIAKHFPYQNIEEMKDAYHQGAGPLTLVPLNDDDTLIQLSPEMRTQLMAIADRLSFKGSHTDIINALLDWVTTQLDSQSGQIPSSSPLLATSSVMETVNYQAQTLSWLTTEVTHLRQQVSQLELENRELNSQLHAANQPNCELEHLKEDHAALEHSLKAANQKIEQFKRLLFDEDQPTPPPQTTSSRDDNLSPPTASFQCVIVPTPSHEAPPSTPSQSPSEKIPPQPTHKKPTGSSNYPPAPLRTGVSQSSRAYQRANAIFEKIQQWNQQHPQSTFALNAGLLEQTFGIHRAVAKEWITQNRELIEQYHLSIGVGNARGHNRGKDTTPLQAFVREQ